MVELSKRLLSSFLIIPIVLLCIYYSHTPYFQPFFLLLGAGLINVSIWEFCKIAELKGFSPSMWIAGLTTIAYVFASQSPYAITPPLVLLAGMGIAFIFFSQQETKPFASIGSTLFAISYLTVPLTTLLQINYLEQGSWWLLYLITVAKSSDAGAYFIGKQWGHHKLAPVISPGKTWEGCFGGLVTSVVISFVIGFWVESLTLTAVESIILGLIIGVLAQFGDLTESILKRDGGIKDSNRIPGLGGFLDILDSLIFTSPLMYLYIKDFHG